MNEIQSILKKIPAVDRVLDEPVITSLPSAYPRSVIVESIQETIEDLRQNLLQDASGADKSETISPGKVAKKAAHLVKKKMTPSLHHVLNATGTLLHTNLGRAPLSDKAVQAIQNVARSYSNLEFDLETGRRGHRYSHVDELLRRLTGAESAAVVNNNAGAVLIALTALAQGKEAVVSRGELVEIGGSFRVPDVMSAGGVKMREVGTTNKTHLKDYQQAINKETGLFLKVHTSNFRIVGFSEEVSTKELVQLGRENGIPVMEDLGSGMLFDLSAYGIPKEPTVEEALGTGIDVVTFSGDKLLGAPQAGIILGKKWAIDKIRGHPMARALRIDKLTLAGLETTLRHYLNPKDALQEIPVLRMLSMSLEKTWELCAKLAELISEKFGHLVKLEIVPEISRIGGGALPLSELPGYALAVTPKNMSVSRLAERLHHTKPPVIGRLHENRLLLNPRTLSQNEEYLLVDSLTAALSDQDASDDL